VDGACVFTDTERRRLAVRAFRVGRQVLREIATVVTPDNIAPLASTVGRP
jgi:hypothetical protein